ncbi:hypothetical protein [Verrucomicrobium sp. GAS474]|uniref:hypothetical protein n=1 Tax=Verrucomicrobium sp. GAS474 TaxID=1882831 RepID=UPI0012FF7E5E|nr:hypothetical protein [Verrucomicrobium sp. GAS474]
MSQTVYAVVDNAIQAEIIVQRLHLNRFFPGDISVRASHSAEIASVLGGLGLAFEKLQRLEAKIEEGGILISVRSENPEEAKLAQRIFRETCLKDVAPSEEREAVLV